MENNDFAVLYNEQDKKVLKIAEDYLKIMMGLCLGHDMILNSKSKAQVTPLVVKDRVLVNNTLERLR